MNVSMNPSLGNLIVLSFSTDSPIILKPSELVSDLSNSVTKFTIGRPKSAIDLVTFAVDVLIPFLILAKKSVMGSNTPFTVLTVIPAYDFTVRPMSVKNFTISSKPALITLPIAPLYDLIRAKSLVSRKASDNAFAKRAKIIVISYANPATIAGIIPAIPSPIPAITVARLPPILSEVTFSGLGELPPPRVPSVVTSTPEPDSRLAIRAESFPCSTRSRTPALIWERQEAISAKTLFSSSSTLNEFLLTSRSSSMAVAILDSDIVIILLLL